jgi:dephospho-CoA kinase
MIFEEMTEDILNEKLITYGNRKSYGQIVFVAGGAGSGKGFAISNFLDSTSFKVRDVDEMKKQLQILNRLGKLDINSIIKKYGKNIKPKDIDLINKIQDD